jgi:hypothetical protein
MAVLAALLAVGLGRAGVETRKPAKERGRDAERLAAAIDQILERRQVEQKVRPAPLADDAEFLRRLTLDLAGRIPSVEEARTFLSDKRPDKRARQIERLLNSPLYVSHFTNVWRALLLPEANNNFQVRLQQPSFEAWLRQRLARNAGYDQLARDLITAPVGKQNGPLTAIGGGEASAIAFYTAKEFKPENLAARTARVFLGVSVECAQCHDHPFASWKREQLWSLAAFYAGIRSQRQDDILLPAPDAADKRELTIPGTKKVVSARFLDGAAPAWKKGDQTRELLARWATSPSNPYFARAAANRMWAYLLGTGLVEPVDEMAGGENEASHPEVLDLLARELAGHHFDLKLLIQAITSTRAYQRTSAGPRNETISPTLFARMPLRGLSAEQLFDSVAMATAFRDSGADDNLISGLLGGKRSARSEFLTRFASTDRPVDSQRSILQALSLMNGRVIAAATTLERSETLAAVVEAPFATTDERIESLYLAALGRPPSSRELARAAAFVQEAGGDKAYRNALADVFWALLNSPEFALNH